MLDRKFWAKAMGISLGAFLMIGCVLEHAFRLSGATLCGFFVWSFVVVILFGFFENEALNRVQRFVERKFAKK